MDKFKIKQKINQKVFDFFVNSHDFNGIPLRQISEDFKIDYKVSIDLIKDLVNDNLISIQSSTNPHIIGFKHYPKESQLQILEMAKETEVEIKKFGKIKISFEKTDYPICLYPSQENLIKNRNLDNFEYSYYSKKLAIGEPQLKPIFFDIDVLERYYIDPRFHFDFDDYSGRISCKSDELYNPLVRKEDDVFIKTFGIGYNKDNNRLAVVYLCYLNNLTGEHQIYWKSKERNDECQMLKEYYQNTIEGNWTFSHSIFSAFLGELKCLNEISKEIFDVPLFNETFEENKRPKEFTFFFIPTIKNYHDFVLLLDKMISDNINKAFFIGKLELYELKEEKDGLIKENKGTIRLLEEWLSTIFTIKGKGSISEILKSFKQVRKERQAPAHKVNENVYDKSLIEKQKKTMSDVYNSMRQLRHIFHQHPKARNYKIPEWLEKRKNNQSIMTAYNSRSCCTTPIKN